MTLRTITLTGTPRQMGRQHGEQLHDEGRRMIATRLTLAFEAARNADPPRDPDWCLALADECVPHLHRYSSAVYEEFLGMAEALDLSPAELVIGNGWTDYVDLLERRARQARHECTAIAVLGDPAAAATTHVAQTWDMNVTAGPFMVLVRRVPADGPQSLSLTTAGCLSLIGINEAGIAVGNTNLAPADARPGVFYLALIHEVLGQTGFAQAVECVTRARRLSGHFYYLGGPNGEYFGLETTAKRHQNVHPTQRFYAHTNHYLDPTLVHEAQSQLPSANSEGRLARMTQLARTLPTDASAEHISQLLRDHEGEDPICRHCDAPAGVATLGAAIMCPQGRTMYAVAGNPCENEFEAHQL